MNCKLVQIVFLFVLALSVACIPKDSFSKGDSAITSVKQAPEIQTSVRESWEVEWDKSVILAKKEKVLIIYSTAGPTFRDAIINAFGKKYDLDVEFIQGRGALIGERLISEHRSGIYMADVFVGGSTTGLTVLKPKGLLKPMETLIILPEVLDKKAWQTEGLNFVDKDRLMLNFARYVNMPLIINTELVKEGEITSFHDLLNPKWKGKIILSDPTIPGGGLNWFSAVGQYMVGFDYMRELAKQDLVITSDQRQQVEWLARGKVAISNPAKEELVNEFIQASAPIKNLMPKEGAYLSASSGNLALIDKAPHLQAAKVFINWLLTKEGQIVASKGLALPSVRNDVPVDYFNPEMLIKPGQKYFESDSEEFIMEKDKYANMAREIFGRLIR